MRWLINYIRSCFCNHDWELLKELKYYNSEYDKRNDMASYIFIVYRCKKCGMVQKVKCC